MKSKEGGGKRFAEEIRRLGNYVWYVCIIIIKVIHVIPHATFFFFHL